MVRSTDSLDLDFRDPAIPGGTLVNALWHRDLMRLSDRGRASELVGDRWADLCAEYLDASVGQERLLPGESEEASYQISQVARLDEVPAIATTASRNKLQNPDFLIIGTRGDTSVVQPADAKFSVETAKSKQVSADVASSLIALGPVITDHVPQLTSEADVVDGFFLCPDFSLTHYMMNRRGGPRGSISVGPEEIELLPIVSADFMQAMDGHELALLLAEKDNFAISPQDSLLMFLYYFRLARACVGCWIDQTAPLLTHRDVPAIDLDAVQELAVSMAGRAESAWGVVQEWDTTAELVRQQRIAIDHATSLPISSSELRTKIEVLSKRAGIVAPSASKIRRMVGSWFRSQIREEYGAILPPIANLPSLLQNLTASSRNLRPALLLEIEQAVNSVAETAEPLAETAVI